MKRVIAVECWADKYFFEKLLRNVQLLRKEKNKSAVIKSIVERERDNFSVGIVDHDNEEVKLFLKNVEIELRNPICEEVEMIKLVNRDHYILQLRPNEFESWIVRFIEKNCNKKLSDFGYKNLKEFTDDSKTIYERLITNKKFNKIINFVLEKYSDSDNHIRKMKNLLDYLVTKNYQIDINELKNA